MDIVLWVLQGLLAAVMLAAGVMKLATSKDALLENPRMAWVEDYSATTVRLIGAVEVAAAIGLVLPWALDVVPVLTPLAAVGVVTLMGGAMITHVRRGERQALIPNVVLAVVAIAVAVGRFAGL